jgi:thiamine biosynthesis lipoprotein
VARGTTRREFLTGVSAAEALADAAKSVRRDASHATVASQAGDESGPASAPTKTYLMQVERQAMACRFAVYLNPDCPREAPEAALLGLSLVAELEDQLSIYRDHSEVSRLNRLAAHEVVEVEERLFGLLSRAIELHRRTGGAFDMTSGPLIKAWGFFRRRGAIPSEQDLAVALECVGSQWIELDSDHREVRFLQEGVEINLGAIGKGYALDRCAERIASEGVQDFLLHGGQSSVLARGRQKTSLTGAKGWTIAVKHPVWPKRLLAEIDLQNKSLGTSGAENQYFFHQGKRYGHILDPRTGQPASGVLAASVIAADAATADALSTAFYVAGVDSAKEYCEKFTDAAALIVTAGERSGSVVLHAIGLEEGEVRFAE